MKKLLLSLIFLAICVPMIGCSSPGSNPTSVYNITIPPSTASTIELQVMAGADDASENGKGTLVTGNELKVSSYPGTTPWQRSSTGLRFQGVNVPREASIITSYISIYPFTTNANDINCNIYVEDTGDADDFVNNPHIINEAYRPRTTYYTAWVEDDLDIDTYVNSPSLNNPLQELFNKPEWTAGNDLVVLMIANENADKKARFWHQEKWLDLSAKLYIEYIE